MHLLLWAEDSEAELRSELAQSFAGKLPGPADISGDLAKPAPKGKSDLAKDKPGFSLEYIPDGANGGVWACQAGAGTWMIARVLAVENRERLMTESGALVNDYVSFEEAYNAAPSAVCSSP